MCLVAGRGSILMVRVRCLANLLHTKYVGGVRCAVKGAMGTPWAIQLDASRLHVCTEIGNDVGRLGKG